jgi:hypothetical protein
MKQYCIYYNTFDLPGDYCVREWHIGGLDGFIPRPGKLIYLGKSLDEARKSIPEGMVCITRSPDDDRVIVETWI